MRVAPLFIVFIAIAAIWFLAATYRFLRDLVRSARSVGAGGQRAMEAMERSIAIADLFTMAVLADGQVTDRKRSALAAALASAKIDIKPGAAINRLRLRTPELKQPERLSAAIATAAERLSMMDRGNALLRIASIARAGAGVPVQGGYREDQEGGPTSARRALRARSRGLRRAARRGDGRPRRALSPRAPMRTARRLRVTARRR
jgi:hypothetical protein